MPINWKARAKKFEQEAFASHANVTKIAFCLEKEKALHRRTCQQANALDIKLKIATTLIYGAAENLAGHGAHASADALRMIVTDLIPRDTCAQSITPKDEQA